MKPEDALVQIEDLLIGLLETLKQFKATSNQHVTSLHSDTQAMSQTVNSLENAVLKAEQVTARIEAQQSNEPRISVNRAKQWVGVSLIAALFFFAAGGYAGWRYAQDSVKDAIAEYNAAAAKLPENAKWVTTPEGQKAKKFAELNNIDRFFACSDKGWTSEKKEGGTYCYPMADDKGNVWGWKIK